MAETTIVNTPAGENSGAGGWAVAVIILVVVIVGGFLWYRSYWHAGSGTTNIQVTMPAPTSPATTS